MPQKDGFAYYQTDTDRYQDGKIKRLKKEFKRDGVAVYDFILAEIYRVKGCFLLWDENTTFDVADYWELKETTVNEIVNYCCHVGLFDRGLFSSGSIITSQSIQRRYRSMSIIAKRKSWKIPESIDLLHEFEDEIPEVERKVKYSKVKKSKVDDEEPSPPPSISEYADTKDIDLLKEKCFYDKGYFTDLHCMHYGITPEQLYQWLINFNHFLRKAGVHQKRETDYRQHFDNWLKKQPSKDPAHFGRPGPEAETGKSKFDTEWERAMKNGK